MDYSADDALGALDAGVGKIQGLYIGLAQEHGMSYAQVQVMYMLMQKDAVTQKQISGTCEIPKQTVNAVVRRLKCDGYVKLVPSETDKREKAVRLTTSGDAFVREQLAPFFEMNKAVVERVGADFIGRLAKDLNAVSRALELEMELKKVKQKWED